MGHSRVIGFLVFILFLVVCVCARADGDVTQEQSSEITKEIAQRAVEDAKNSITAVSGQAESEITKAKSVLGRVKSSKTISEQEDSQADKAPKDNSNAQDVVKNIKNIVETISTLYLEAKGKLETAISSMEEVQKEAANLKTQCDSHVVENDASKDTYRDIHTTVSALKDQSDELKTNINNAVNAIGGVDATVGQMEKNAINAQLANIHINGIVAVAKIQTIMREAEDITTKTNNKKEEVNGIVAQMTKHCTNELTQSNKIIKEQCKSANDALTSANGAVDVATNAVAAIKQQKRLAETALKNVPKETAVSPAEAEVKKAEGCVTAAEEIVPKLNNALQTATNSVITATDSQQKLHTALSTATSATRTEKRLTQPQVKPLQERVSDNVKTIQSMMEEADGTLRETVNHKQTVHVIVQEMKKLSTTDFIESNKILKVLYKSAEDALADATDAVKKAEKAKTHMAEQKKLSDDALSNVATATDITTAQNEVDTTNKCVKQVQQYAANLKSALQIAKDSVTNARALKQKLMTALSTTTTAPSTVQATETAKAHPPVGQGTEPDQKDATIQPTSKELPSQHDNRSEKLKDALSNGAHNVPTTSLTGGKAPAPGANNDSAMTLSVPLLVALIASAVLQ